MPAPTPIPQTPTPRLCRLALCPGLSSASTSLLGISGASCGTHRCLLDCPLCRIWRLRGCILLILASRVPVSCRPLVVLSWYCTLWLKGCRSLDVRWVVPPFAQQSHPFECHLLLLPCFWPPNLFFRVMANAPLVGLSPVVSVTSCPVRLLFLSWCPCQKWRALLISASPQA